jgi:tRNA dimethylallyltransferase
MMPIKKKIIVIAGPTASGKTSLAIKLAQQLNTSIISADSRQCYKEMSIGVAKPTELELAQAPHYFINTHSIHTALNAGDYEQLGLNYLQSIFNTEQKNVAIVVGGTGLYINALCYGIDPMPAIDKSIDAEVNYNYKTKGIAWLQKQVMEKDNDFYQQAEQQNPARLIRALVFKLSTGTSILAYRKKEKKVRDFDIDYYAININKEQLHKNIETRVDAMMHEGLMQEATALYNYKHLKNLNTVGYTELFDYLDNKVSLAEAIQLIKTHTKQYAKRQITWFKKDENYKWMSAEEIYRDACK